MTYAGHHLAVVVRGALSTVIAMMCEVYRRPGLMIVVAREDVMLYSDITHLLYASTSSVIVSKQIGILDQGSGTCVGSRIGRSAEDGMFTGMTLGISGETVGDDDGSSAIEGVTYRDCVQSYCSRHLVNSDFAMMGDRDISNVDRSTPNAPNPSRITKP